MGNVHPIEPLAQGYPYVIERINHPVEMNTDFTGAETLAVASAVVTGIAAFLPWVTASVQAGPVDVSTSATGIEGLGILTLLLAVVALGTVVLLDGDGWETVATAVVGLVVFLFGVWKILDLGGAASPGVGLYLTVIGGIGLAIAGLWGHRARSTRATPEGTR